MNLQLLGPGFKTASPLREANTIITFTTCAKSFLKRKHGPRRYRWSLKKKRKEKGKRGWTAAVDFPHNGTFGRMHSLFPWALIA